LKVFKNAWFGRFARKENISADALWDAVERAEKGQVDADLGGGVIKQRIARPGEGKQKATAALFFFARVRDHSLCMVLPRANLAISEMTKSHGSK